MHPMAPLMSASSKTTQAPLPPSSSSVRFIVRAAFSAMVTPTWVEPVKLTQSTSSASTSAAEAAGPLPLTRLTTPGGKPTSLRMRTSSTMARGSCGAGLTTTVLPAASAGATLPAMLTMGKLYEVMQATTPTGWRLTMPPMIPPGARGRGLGRLGQQRRLQDLARVAGVALETVGRHGHLHARADGGGGARLGDHQREQLGRLGPDGRRRCAHERAAVVLGPGRPARLGLPGRRRGGEGVVRAGVGREPDDLLGGRVDDFVGPVGGVDPLAPDEELVLVALAGLGHVCSRECSVAPASADLTARHIQPRPGSCRQKGRFGPAPPPRREARQTGRMTTEAAPPEGLLLPLGDEESDGFWAGTAAGELRAQRCSPAARCASRPG